MVDVINKEKFGWDNEKIEKKIAELIMTKGIPNAFKTLGITEGIMKKIESTVLQIELNEDFLHAAFNGDLNKVKSLLEHGADINSKEPAGGGTALHNAAGFGKNVDLVKFLIDNGLDVNAKDNFGVTPLNGAVSMNCMGIVKLLIENGADINVKGEQHGHSILWSAAWNGYMEVIQFLIDNGAEVNSKDNYGETPLNIAEDMGRTEAVALLKKNGAKKGSKL